MSRWAVIALLVLSCVCGCVSRALLGLVRGLWFFLMFFGRVGSLGALLGGLGSQRYQKHRRFCKVFKIKGLGNLSSLGAVMGAILADFPLDPKTGGQHLIKTCRTSGSVFGSISGRVWVKLGQLWGSESAQT